MKEKKVKTEKSLIRKEINDFLKTASKQPLSKDEFKLYASQLFSIDDVQMLFKNRTRASVVNNIIRRDSRWPEICELRRVENSENAKKQVASLVKEALVSQLSRNYPSVTKDNVEDFVSELAQHKYDSDKLSQLQEMYEKDRLKDVEKYMAENLPVYLWCKKVKGLGTKLSAKILSTIDNIDRFPNPSSLWSYCGVGDPEKAKMKKGQQANFNPKMRATLYVLAESMIKQNSQYKAIYEKRKEYTKRTHPIWHKLNEDGTPFEGENKHPQHAHKDAMRVMIKRFLCELFKAWYLSEGKEVPSKPFGVEIKGHHEEPDIVPYKKSENL